jgi:hypothetical protein
MATIIETKHNHKRYLLIGTGYGEYESATPGFFLGNLAPSINHGNTKLVCVCDKGGKIGWIPSDEVLVIEVDGKLLFNYDIHTTVPD